jgi:hypothetical protein
MTPFVVNCYRAGLKLSKQQQKSAVMCLEMGSDTDKEVGKFFLTEVELKRGNLIVVHILL